MLIKDEGPIARNLLNQLSVFATGAPVRFGDREQIDKMMQHLAPGHYAIRDMIHEIVQSDMFQSK